MPDVVLIRPGCTDFDEQNRIQGSLDLPLSRRGQEQVELVVRQLRGVRLDVVYSAPCEPARSTAIAVCDECGATFKEVADFRNLNHGLWQGLQVDDARRKYPKVFKQWQESPETVCLPEGETVAQAVERIERGLRKCLKRKRNVGIVASEPLATLIVCVLCGCRPELPDAAACCRPERRIEFLRLSESEGAMAVMASASAIGRDRNGNEAEGDATGRNGQKKTNGTAPIRDTAAVNDNGEASGAKGAEPKAGQPANSESADLPTTTPRRAPE
jgi:broad specificity phosphatase PhoE